MEPLIWRSFCNTPPYYLGVMYAQGAWSSSRWTGIEPWLSVCRSVGLSIDGLTQPDRVHAWYLSI